MSSGGRKNRGPVVEKTVVRWSSLTWSGWSENSCRGLSRWSKKCRPEVEKTVVRRSKKPWSGGQVWQGLGGQKNAIQGHTRTCDVRRKSRRNLPQTSNIRVAGGEKTGPETCTFFRVFFTFFHFFRVFFENLGLFALGQLF